jgi:hypothetical protein
MRPTKTALYPFAAIMFAWAIGASAPALSQGAPDGTFIGDVPYVATPQDVVDSMLDLAKVGPGDYVIDLGSGVSDRAQFFQRDLFETDFARATVLTMYLLPDINLALRPKVLGLKPGTRVVSHDFDMGDWVPDERLRMRSAVTHYESNAYLWIVPANAAGRWQAEGGDALRFEIAQTFQQIKLQARNAQGPLDISEARLGGDKISFTAGGRAYEGRIDGDVITGVVRGGAGASPWSAKRVQ